MGVRIAVSVLMLAVMLLADAKGFKQMSGKERLVYALLTIAACYVGIIFIAEPGWPNLTDLLQYAFGPITKGILRYFK